MTGENLGVEPFSDLCGDEEHIIIKSREDLLDTIRSLPLVWNSPGVKGSDFLTPENCPEAF